MSDWFRKLVTKAIRVNGVEQPNQPALNIVAGTGIGIESESLNVAAENNSYKGETRVTLSVDVEALAEAVAQVPVREIAGTSHTLELDDRARQMRSTNVSDTTITVPPQSSVAWPANARVPMLRLPAGRLTIAPGAGVTIATKTGFETSTLGPVGAVMLERVGEDQWVLYGDLEEST